MADDTNTTKNTTGRTTAPRRKGQRPTEYGKAVAQEIFIEAFRESANVKMASQKAHIDRSTAYRWRESEPDFAEKWEAAEQDANDNLRAEIYRRAVQGWEEPVVSAGKLVTTVHKYSDNLLMFLSKARMPEFRERVDVNGNLTVGAYRVIEQASSDPDTTALANELLSRLALPSPSPDGSTSGPRMDSDPTDR